MAFTDPIPSEDTVDRLYSDRSSRDFDASKTDRITRIRRRFSQRDVRALCNGVPTHHAQILDYGCGSGDYSIALHDVFPAASITASDYHANRPPLLAGERRADIAYVPYAALELLKGSFSIILARHVLEHIHRPVEILRMLSQLLRPGGVLIAECPAFESPLRRLFGSNWEPLYVPFHPIHFTLAALEEAMQVAGFEVVASSYAEMPMIGRSLQNILNRPYGAALFAVGALLHPLQLLLGKLSGTGVVLRVRAQRPVQ